MKHSRRVTTGLVLNGLLGLANLPTLIAPTTGPAPVAVNVADGILGIATIVGVVLAWRGAAVAGVVLIVVSQVLNILSAAPSFVADVGTDIKLISGALVVVTALALWLIAPARRQRASAPAA